MLAESLNEVKTKTTKGKKRKIIVIKKTILENEKDLLAARLAWRACSPRACSLRACSFRACSLTMLPL
jgi:hypothetical protein